MSEAKEPKKETAQVKVAPRRTLVTGIGPKHEHGPGAVLRLPKEDIPELIANGTLVDPHATQIEAGIGPDFNEIKPA